MWYEINQIMYLSCFNYNAYWNQFIAYSLVSKSVIIDRSIDLNFNNSMYSSPEDTPLYWNQRKHINTYGWKLSWLYSSQSNGGSINKGYNR